MKKTNVLKTVAMTLTMTMSMGLLAGCGSSQTQQTTASTTEESAMLKIGVVQLLEHGALDSANKGFVDGLAAAGFVQGENITIDQQNGQGDQSNLQTISQKFVNENVDLICAIATQSAVSAANATAEIPIVGTAITDYVEAKLVESNEQPNTNVTGTTDMNPIKEQIDLLIEMVPQTKTIGVIYTSSEINSQLQVDIMKEYAATLGLDVREATVSTANDIQQAAQSLVGKVEAIYVPTDNVVASAMPTLVDITNPAKIPVICGESSMVETGGMATYGIDYYNLGVQTGKMAAEILNGNSTPADMAIESLQDLTLVINKTAADEMGLTIPQELLDRAEII